MVHNEPNFTVIQDLTIGGIRFEGYVTNASLNQIPNTKGWYETHVTLIGVAN
jgi:hypothetical protein